MYWIIAYIVCAFMTFILSNILLILDKGKMDKEDIKTSIIASILWPLTLSLLLSQLIINIIHLQKQINPFGYHRVQWTNRYCGVSFMNKNIVRNLQRDAASARRLYLHYQSLDMMDIANMYHKLITKLENKATKLTN